MKRSFCSKCGSSVTSDVEAMPDLEWIKAGTLDNTTWLNPTVNILCDSAQRWAHIAESAVLARVDPLSKTKENECPLQGLKQPCVNSGPMTTPGRLQPVLEDRTRPKAADWRALPIVGYAFDS